MKPKHYSAQEIFNFCNLGIIFEFYSTKNADFIVENLSRRTSKNIILTNENNYNPTYSNAILIKEYEAKKSRYQLHLAEQNYSSMLPIIREVNKWIVESAETTHDTLMKVSLSFNQRHLETLQTISGMNPIRLVLKIDEAFIYDRFPEQKFSAYALSVKSMSPVTAYVSESELQQNINNIITMPQAEYYGIDFSDYTRGILRFNYIGGKNYAEKTTAIQEMLDYFIIKAYQSLNEEDYSPFEMHEMYKITQGLEKFQKSYYDVNSFLKEFTNIKIYIDLKTSEQLVKTFWNNLRKPLFEMIIKGGLNEGQFNLDTDTSKIQLRGARLNATFLKNIEFFQCDINGVLENCNFTSCKLLKSRVYSSKFIKGNSIVESYLYHVSVNNDNEINKSYIINDNEVVNCDISESIVKFATPGQHIKIDEGSTIIVKNQLAPKRTDAIKIETIRDYSWIKAMNKTGDTGYGNAYTKDFIKQKKYKTLS